MKPIKNIDLFCPGTNAFIFDFIYQLGYYDRDFGNLNKENTIKKEVLEAIKILIYLEVMYIKNWYDKQEISKNLMTTNAIIEEIDKIWFNSARYPDFFNMLLFGNPEWYFNSLKKIGMSETTDWKTFVNENIGNLEKWI